MHSDAHDEHKYSEKRMHSLKKAACLCRLEDFLANHKAHSGLKPKEFLGNRVQRKARSAHAPQPFIILKRIFDAGRTGVEPVSEFLEDLGAARMWQNLAGCGRRRQNLAKRKCPQNILTDLYTGL